MRNYGFISDRSQRSLDRITEEDVQVLSPFSKPLRDMLITMKREETQRSGARNEEKEKPVVQGRLSESRKQILSTEFLSILDDNKLPKKQPEKGSREGGVANQGHQYRAQPTKKPQHVIDKAKYRQRLRKNRMKKTEGGASVDQARKAAVHLSPLIFEGRLSSPAAQQTGGRSTAKSSKHILALACQQKLYPFDSKHLLSALETEDFELLASLFLQLGANCALLRKTLEETVLLMNTQKTSKTGFASPKKTSRRKSKLLSPFSLCIPSTPKSHPKPLATAVSERTKQIIVERDPVKTGNEVQTKQEASKQPAQAAQHCQSKSEVMQQQSKADLRLCIDFNETQIEATELMSSQSPTIDAAKKNEVTNQNYTQPFTAMGAVKHMASENDSLLQDDLEAKWQSYLHSKQLNDVTDLTRTIVPSKYRQVRLKTQGLRSRSHSNISTSADIENHEPFLTGRKNEQYLPASTMKSPRITVFERLYWNKHSLYGSSLTKVGADFLGSLETNDILSSRPEEHQPMSTTVPAWIASLRDQR